MPFLKRETKTFLRKMLGALEGGGGGKDKREREVGGKKERFVKRVGRET